MNATVQIEVIDDDDEEERSTEENLFLLSQVSGRPYDVLLQEYSKRKAHEEFWADPCWANDN